MKGEIDFFTGCYVIFGTGWSFLCLYCEKGPLKGFCCTISFSYFFCFSLKLAKSFIISGIYFGIFCSKSRLFARSIRMPSFLCNKLKTNVLSSRTNPGLLQLLIKFLSLCSRSVHVIPCFLFRFWEHLVDFLDFLLKSDHTTIFSVPFFDTLLKFFTLLFSP